MKLKALALISGGLDSILAALLVKNQGIKVTGLGFKSLFFDPSSQLKKLCSQINIPLKIIDFSEKHLEIVRTPPHGYGKNANPCIDCHLLMLKEAKKIMSHRAGSSSGRQEYNFIITGEILGQRPFSQNQASLNLIEKESGLKNLILRPLSAKLLPPTIPEQGGWIDRHKLLDISGRSRKTQLRLAGKFKLKNYSTPGASCILTDRAFTQKLFNLLKARPHPKPNDIHLLRLGRHFWVKATRLNSPNGTRLDKQSGISRKFGGSALLVIGRNHEENLQLKKLSQKKDFILEPQSFPGPTILIRSWQKTDQNQVFKRAKKLLLKYSPKAPEKIKKKDLKIS